MPQRARPRAASPLAWNRVSIPVGMTWIGRRHAATGDDFGDAGCRGDHRVAEIGELGRQGLRHPARGVAREAEGRDIALVEGVVRIDDRNATPARVAKAGVAEHERLVGVVDVGREGIEPVRQPRRERQGERELGAVETPQRRHAARQIVRLRRAVDLRRHHQGLVAERPQFDAERGDRVFDPADERQKVVGEHCNPHGTP